MSLFTITRSRHWGAIALASVSIFGLSACGLAQADSVADEDRTITMIVTESAPYQEPTDIVKEQLKEKGWELETTYVTDIVLPNTAVENGEYDVNFFQHQAYLRQFNKDQGTSIEPMFSVYYGRSGLFSTKVDSLEDLKQGARIAIPVDTSNNGRALSLLAAEGVIKVDKSVEPTQLSQQDITDNPKNLQFVEVDQQTLGKTLEDVDAGFVFVRQIAEAGLDYDDTVLALEDNPEITRAFTVVVAANPEFRDTEAARVLEQAYQSEEVGDWYAKYHNGVVQHIDNITTENSAQEWSEFSAQ